MGLDLSDLNKELVLATCITGALALVGILVAGVAWIGMVYLMTAFSVIPVYMQVWCAAGVSLLSAAFYYVCIYYFLKSYEQGRIEWHTIRRYDDNSKP